VRERERVCVCVCVFEIERVSEKEIKQNKIFKNLRIVTDSRVTGQQGTKINEPE